jgi:hypothetical protein
MMSKRVLVRLYVKYVVQAKVLTTSLPLDIKLNIGPVIINPTMIVLKTVHPLRPRNVGMLKRQIHLICLNATSIVVTIEDTRNWHGISDIR